MTASFHCAVFGNPIAHSLSPMLHQYFASSCGIKDFFYEKVLVDPTDIERRIHAFFEQGGKGLNITLPFKQTAYTLAEHLTPRAKAAQAVNTLWMEKGILCGDNTDGIGLVQAINDRHLCLQDKNILLIGTGGAARGALLPLLEQSCHHLHIANRTLASAQQLEASFQQAFPTRLSSSSLNTIPNTSWDIIINASSSSLSDRPLVLDQTLFAQAELVYDMVYTPSASTPFLEEAKKAGATQVEDGLSMLVNQGAQAFFIWTGKMPDTHEALYFLRTQLRHS